MTKHHTCYSVLYNMEFDLLGLDNLSLENAVKPPTTLSQSFETERDSLKR
jgi:hypothetical protein